MTQEINWLLKDKYAGVEAPEFEADVLRIKNGEPVAYVIGWAPFINTRVWLDSKPLIPRTETEYWVSHAIEEIKNSEITNPKILDLCAGSGCIGVAILKEIPGAEVDFAEIDILHHETIRKNIKENGLYDSKTKIFGGDLFGNITETYDFILSNPPYVDPSLKERVGESVKTHEPEKALYGGVGGLEIIEKILSNAKNYLKPGGILYLEHEPEQAEALSKNSMFTETGKDQFGVLRFSKLKA